MKFFQGLFGRVSVLSLVFLFCSLSVLAQQSSGTLRGRVADEFGGLIIGATVTVTDASGVEKTATTDNEGNYAFPSLAPGRYQLHAVAPGFATFENTALEVAAGRNEPLNITLSVAVEAAEVTVTAEPPVSTEPENNIGAVVLRGTDLDALPDDPDDLQDALQALAGPSAGLNGGDIFIDGFTGGRLPPKESIREVRINRNPFSAEYDRLGYGRIEIFTKPGTDKLRGQAFFNFNDESLNSRNPFAPSRAPFQSRRYGGNLSGPISAKKASYFLDFERRETDDNAVIRAVILDPALNITSLSDTILTPARRTTFSPRLDYQINSTNTLVARYTFAQSRNINSGVGDVNLASRAFNTENREHTLQLTETAVINQKIINETRFQYVRERRRQVGDNSTPTIRVLDAFTGGGSQVGLSLSNQDNWELQNYTSWTTGTHSLKAGARLRGVKITDVSPQNFAGTFTFAGGDAPVLDANNQIVIDPATGQPLLTAITSIERYRRTLLFQQQGLTPAEIRARGGGATQFSIAGGNPQASVTRWDLSPFIQDDWRYRPNLTLSLGLRYETQNNIHSRADFAPRLAFAWAPGAGGGAGGGGARQQKTVIRGGVGIFYDRFSESLTLQTNRFNGTNQQQFLITDATPNGTSILDLFPVVPSITTLEGFSIPQITRVVASDLRTPYTMQAAFSFERQLPYNISLSTSFISARTLHVLRSRAIGPAFSTYQYESSGRFNQNQLIVSLNSRFSRNATLYVSYALNKANSDTDGAVTFPANQFDLSTEYGRSSVDIRHRLSIVGSIAAPWGLRLNPFIIVSSGRPFNITIGRDVNGDRLFTDRPAFAAPGADCNDANIRCTAFGNFNLNPQAGDAIIPRNFGEGPSFFTVNMRVSKTFGFGEERAAGTSGGGRGGRGGGGGGRGGRGGFGGGRGGGGAFGGDTTPGKRYNLTLSINAQNLLNHSNLGTPVGNLSSPLFGQSINTSGGFGGFGSGGGGGNMAAGNRRIEMQVRFSF